MIELDPHRPAHASQLEDALYATRRALSALRAVDTTLLPHVEHERLSRLAATLCDVAEELARESRT